MKTIQKINQISLLPTDNAENCLVMNPSNKISFSTGLLTKSYREDYYLKVFHLYVTNDETPKVGDWVIKPDKTIHRMTHDDMIDYLDSQSKATKKIIASTDKLFIRYFMSSNGQLKNEYIPTLSKLAIERFISDFNLSGDTSYKIKVNYEVRTDFTDMKDALEGDTFRLIVNDNNTINTSPVKTSWDESEVSRLMRNILSDFRYSYPSANEIDNYIKDKLFNN